MKQEGYIKFGFELEKERVFYPQEIKILNEGRNKLYSLGLIGAYPNGVGFGNISLRLGESKFFLISASASGNITELTAEHYVEVKAFDIEKNFAWCKGERHPSSETLSHAMFYAVDTAIGAVVHVHSRALWQKLCGKAPATAGDVEYGTPQMAREIESLFNKGELKTEGLAVMGGHAEGIFSFAADVERAVQLVLEELESRAPRVG